MNIFVANLSFDLQSEELEQLFEQFGEVSSTKVILDRETGKSRGFGFVEMPNDDEANAAIEQLNEMLLEGRNIVVKEARPQENRGGGGGGFRRGGGGGGGGYNRGGGGGDRGGYNRGGNGGRGERGGYSRGGGRSERGSGGGGYYSDRRDYDDD